MGKLLYRNIAKQCVAVCLALALLGAFAVFGAADARAYRFGDVDANGNLSPADARWILRASVGLEDYSVDSDVFRAADSDRDGKLTAADARWTLRASVGLEYLPPAPQSADTALLKEYLGTLTERYGAGTAFQEELSHFYISDEGKIAETLSREMEHFANGVISAYIADFNGDDTPEMIVARLEQGQSYWKVILSHYYVSGGAVAFDSDFYTGEEFGNGHDFISVYLTEQDDRVYINIIDNFGARSSATNQSFSLFTFGVNGDQHAVQLHRFTDFIGSWGRYGYTLDEENVTATVGGDEVDFTPILNKSAAAFAGVGITGWTKDNAFEFPSRCQRILSCGTSLHTDSAFVTDYSGYLEGLQIRDFTDDSARAMEKEANKLYWTWLLACYRVDFSKKTTYNGKTYYQVKDSPYHSVAELKEALSEYFTADMYSSAVDKYLLTYNGELYGIEGGTGDIPPTSVNVSVLSQTAGKCVFRVQQDYNDSGKNTVRTIYSTLVRENGKWVFTDLGFVFYEFE